MKKASMPSQIIRKIITPKGFVFLALCYLAACALEDYFFWDAKQEWSSAVFGVVSDIIAIAMVLIAICIFVRTVRNKGLTWPQKTLQILLLIGTFICIQAASYWIHEYLAFKGGGMGP